MEFRARIDATSEAIFRFSRDESGRLKLTALEERPNSRVGYTTVLDQQQEARLRDWLNEGKK